MRVQTMVTVISLSVALLALSSRAANGDAAGDAPERSASHGRDGKNDPATKTSAPNACPSTEPTKADFADHDGEVVKLNDDEAIAEATKAIKNDPSDVEAFRKRAHAIYDRFFAAADYEAILRLRPHDVEANLAVGHLSYSLGRGDFGLANFTEAINADPNNSEARGARGAAYYWKKQYDRAIADFTEAARIDPTDGSSYGARAACYEAKGDLDHALADYTKSLDRFQSLGVYHPRGRVYFVKGEIDKAIGDYSKSISLGNPDPAVYLSRAEAYEKKGDTARAKSDRETAERVRR